jgi:aminoglycoside phosphotransferase (APT) family kinase protein
MTQSSVDRAELQALLHETFGSECRLEGIETFKGGARKQVYVLDLVVPEMRCVLYIWQDLNHYFAEREAFETAHSDAEAPGLFQANAVFLQDLGVDVPRVYRFGELKVGHAFALVEYIGAKNLTAFLETASAEFRDATFRRVGQMLRTINDQQRDYPGTVLDRVAPSTDLPHQVALERALLEARVTASHHASVAEHLPRIEARLYSMVTALKPKTSYRLVHGELGPEHILIRQTNHAPCFIDVDGVHFDDLESEHALLSFRFEQDNAYQTYFQRDDLEENRMRFYRFALHVSYVYAGSQFVAKNYHDLEWAQNMFDYNLEQVLAIV